MGSTSHSIQAVEWQRAKSASQAVSMGNSEWCAAIHASNFTTTIGIIIRAKKSKKMG